MNLRSPGATKLLGALALVLVAGLGWLLVLGPRTEALATVRAETEAASAQNESLRQQLVVLEKQQADLPRTRADAKALAAMFPATADQPGLFQAVTDAASTAGIPARKVTALTPTPPQVGDAQGGTGAAQLPTEQSSGRLARQTVTVSIQATYDQTWQLLENLERIPRAYLVTSITMSTGGESDAYVTTVTGEMFVMPPAEEPAPADSSAAHD